jgi:enamine deaminase RidA (YjgF/YER057c/UK114 family)
MERRTYSSGGPYEPIVGYSRAVRVGQAVYVAGTTATGADGRIVGEGDAYAQTVQIFKTIAAALRGLDCRLEDVVRTRIFVTNVADWEAVGRAHGEIFRNIRPACTLVAVSRLVDPAMLVEIEVDAVAS